MCVEAENIENINQKLNIEAESSKNKFEALQTLVHELETSNSQYLKNIEDLKKQNDVNN